MDAASWVEGPTEDTLGLTLEYKAPKINRKRLGFVKSDNPTSQGTL
jgi:hypothetical protein